MTNVLTNRYQDLAEDDPYDVCVGSAKHNQHCAPKDMDWQGRPGNPLEAIGPSY
jgi:hypothetical protein